MTKSIDIKTRKKKISAAQKEARWFYAFIAPWLLGFLIFTLGPILASFYMSFTDWDMFSKANFVGFDNYVRLFTVDKVFWKTVYNTFYYVLLAVPVTTILSLLMAYLLNQKVKGLRIFRTIYYLPSVVPIVATSMVFIWVLAPDIGLINMFLSIFGIDGPAWLLDPKYVKLSFVFMAIWGVGANMILLLSGMQGISAELYESASLDGAGKFKQFIKITVPMLSPVIFFNVVMGIIRGLQAFSEIYIMTQGGPNNSSNMMVPYLFENAFKYYRMGYASSIAWILFIIIMLLTLLVFKTSSAWVYYEGEVKK